MPQGTHNMSEADAPPLSVQFASAVQAGERACLQTSVAVMRKASRAAQLHAAMAAPSAKVMAALIVEIAGPAFVSQLNAQPSMSALKATKLGEALLEMAWSATPAPHTTSAALDPAQGVRRLELFSRTLQRWIDEGTHGTHADLRKAGELVSRAEQRLAILAPAASTLGVCIGILKADLRVAPETSKGEVNA
jgi:hypothetical protein